MNPIVLYCKSYCNDVQRVKILLDSVEKHNKDGIPFYISVPSTDITMFKMVLGERSTYTLITDEEILGNNLEQSWVNQQIVKVSFWKLKNCFNYLVLDSDSYFIRDFFIKDFIYDGVIPYTVIHQQKNLFEWTCKNKNILGFDPSISFGECRYPIMELFGRKGKIYDFGPCPFISSCLVWESLEENYIKPNNLKIEDLIRLISSEFSWYGETLLTWKPIELHPIEPLFKVMHYLDQYQEYKRLGYTEKHWSENYLGIVCQSSSGLPLKY